jgi:trimeric autotransporter adhesin
MMARKAFLLPILLCLPTLASAQFYNITTFAGSGKEQFSGGGQAINTEIIEPEGLAVDSAGNFYVSDTYFDQVFKVTPGGVITAYAGNGQEGFSGDGGLATAAQLFNPRGLAVDASGNLYIADTGNNRVRKVSPSGVISTAVNPGNGIGWVASDAAGDLYITSGNSILRADPSGNVTTFAGTNQPGLGGDGGPATAAMLAAPGGVGVDSAGNVYVADSGNNVIRKINPQGIISTIAGTPGKYGFSGDGGAATSAMLFQPSDVSPDAMGNLYIDDGLNYRIRVVNSEGVISTVAGGGGSLQNGPPSGAAIAGAGIQVDGSGNILVAEPGYRVVRRVVPHQSISTVAGVLPTAAAGDGLQATSISLLQPFGVGVNGGNVYITDVLDNRLRMVSPTGIITTVAGNGIPGGSGNGGPASQAGLNGPLDFGFDPAGDLYLSTGLVIREITASGTIMAFAGTSPGYGGDGGLAIEAQLYGPADAVGDSNGNVYISDKVNNLIRKVNASGVISTYAGNAATRAAGFTGDGGLATEAELSTPYQLALDSSDNLYIADYGNNRVRKITPDDIISTVAGGGTGALGDGGPATSATVGGDLNGVAVDAAGNLYIATNARIRKVNAATGNISTIAGTGTPGFGGDGGLATLALINGAVSIAVDGSGKVYFSDAANLRVRMLTPAQIVKEGVLNGATFLAGGVAPGEIITIYGGPGVTLGPASALGIQLDAAGRVATSVGGHSSDVRQRGRAIDLRQQRPGQCDCAL